VYSDASRNNRRNAVDWTWAMVDGIIEESNSAAWVGDYYGVVNLERY